jgi:hypothetical protein
MTQNKIEKLKKVKAVTNKYQYWLHLKLKSGCNIEGLTFENYCKNVLSKRL